MPDLTPTIDARTSGLKIANVNTTVGLENTTEMNGTALNTSETTMTVAAINSSNFAGQFDRYTVEFDTSDITSTPTSAVLKLYGMDATHPEFDFYLVKTTLITDGDIVSGDHREWLNDGDDNYDIDNKVAYSSKFDVSEDWDDDAYNEISLNSTALSDMVSRDNFQITIVSHFEYDQTTFGNGSHNVKFHTNDASSADNRPVLTYIEAGKAGPGILNLSSGTVKVLGGKLIIK